VPDVETVTGKVDVSALGRTLMHEHIFVLSPEIESNYPSDWDEEARVAGAVDRLNELVAAGISTIVDLTVVGLGRYIPRIERVAAQTDLNIIVATGLYTYGDLPHYFHFRGPGTLLGGPEIMVDMFVGDIEQGIGGTNVKAGVLKCATDAAGVTPGVERVLRAVAAAHRATGVPISTHTDSLTRRGLDQQDIFEAEGVDLSRVVIGHSGDTTDIAYLEEVIARGSWLGMDRFGIDVMLPFEQRVQIVADLCARGHHTKIVLSHDASCECDWFEQSAVSEVAPRWHYLHITQDVVPALMERGVTEEQITAMLVDNPREIFARQGAY
jgi:phosphotriesterase-related protein